MSVRATIAQAIDAQAVSKSIAGKTMEAAKEYLPRQFALRSEPQIELGNSLLQRLPWWARRIRVQVSTG
jgi:hypothetical protein